MKEIRVEIEPILKDHLILLFQWQMTTIFLDPEINLEALRDVSDSLLSTLRIHPRAFLDVFQDTAQRNGHVWRIVETEILEIIQEQVLLYTFTEEAHERIEQIEHKAEQRKMSVLLEMCGKLRTLIEAGEVTPDEAIKMLHELSDDTATPIEDEQINQLLKT